MWIGDDFADDGENWANWIIKNLPDGGNILFLSGPAGNSQGVDECKALQQVLDPTASTSSSASRRSCRPTGTRPRPRRCSPPRSRRTRRSTSSSPTSARRWSVRCRCSRRAAGRSRRSPRPTATRCRCFWEDQQGKNPDFKMFTVATGNDNVRLAVDWAVAKATGGKTPRRLVQGAGVRGLGQRQAEPGDLPAGPSRRHLPVRRRCPARSRRSSASDRPRRPGRGGRAPARPDRCRARPDAPDGRTGDETERSDDRRRAARRPSTMVLSRSPSTTAASPR